MTSINKAVFVLIGLIIPGMTFSQVKYSNEFLSIGVGARGLALGGAQSAVVGDASAGFWNPAGLVRVKSNLQLFVMHNEYFGGIGKYDYASFAAPIDATRTIGASFIRFAIDDIIDSTDLIDKDGNIDYDRLKTFSSADYAFLFSYAQTLKVKGLSAGGNVKVIHRKVGDFANAWGFGLDAGLQYEHDRWNFGLMGKDITSTFNAWSYNTESLQDVFAQTGNEIPQNGLEVTLPKLIGGVSYKFNISKKVTATPMVDLDFTFDGKRNVPIKSDVVSIDPKGGLELSKMSETAFNEFTTRYENNPTFQQKINNQYKSIDREEKGYTGYITQDGIPPNGAPFTAGIAFPMGPTVGQFCLRKDYLPYRLFRYNGTRWVKVEDVKRMTMNNLGASDTGAGDTFAGKDVRQTQKTSFINNDNTDCIDHRVVEEKQALSKALRPKADE